jgi:D-3-phosphoglycerate dehydrogenase / 2-oxoglutarate reductase
MRVVISDDYQDCVRHLKCFSKLQHHDVTIYNDTVHHHDDLVKRFQDAQAIVLIRERTVIKRSLIECLPNLQLISQTGKMASHVDLTACKDHNIVVTDGRGSGRSTVELTMLLTLAALRNLVPEVNRLQNGQWQGSVGRQLFGKTFGVYGFGKIGEQICHLAQAFGAKVVVWGRPSSLQKAQENGFAVASSKEDFFSRCNIISLQLRLTPETKYIVSADDLALMQTDALLVNTSRAELIEKDALVQALKNGRPGFAAVDVFEDEPVYNANHPLIQLPNCLCSPHLGFVEQDNYEAYFGAAFDNINAFCNGQLQERVV